MLIYQVSSTKPPGGLLPSMKKGQHDYKQDQPLWRQTQHLKWFDSQACAVEYENGLTPSGKLVVENNSNLK